MELCKTWVLCSLADSTLVSLHLYTCRLVTSLWHCVRIYVHVGIDDARNTAKLCYRMVRDGCRMDITKCIQSRVSRHILSVLYGRTSLLWPSNVLVGTSVFLAWQHECLDDLYQIYRPLPILNLCCMECSCCQHS